MYLSFLWVIHENRLLHRLEVFAGVSCHWIEIFEIEELKMFRRRV